MELTKTLNTDTAVILARVSSREQEETGYSLPAQEKFLKDYCYRKPFKIAKVFSISESASPKSQREIFNAMIAHVRKYKVKIIVCEKVDRLTRTFKDAVLIDDWLAEDEDRQAHLVKDSLILHKNSLAHEKLNWGVRVLFAKNYIDNLSEEVRKGLKEKAAQGWQPNRPPPGYKTAEKDGHKIHVVDEDFAPTIRRIFERYASSNYSLNFLVDVLSREGFRTPSGKKMYKSKLHFLLSNPFYCGKFRWNGEIYEGKHEPLVSKEIFDAVQAGLKRNIKGTQYKKHLPTFKGKIRCGECTGLVTWERQRGHWYGHCNKYRKCSQRAYVRQEEIEVQLLPLFDKVAPTDNEVLAWIKDALKQSLGDKIEFMETQKRELDDALKRAEKRLEAIYEDKIDQKITLQFYEKKAAQYAADKEEILDELIKLEHADTKYYELGVALHELAANARAIYLNPKSEVNDKRTLLSCAFSNITLKGREIRAEYSLAFKFLAEWVPQLNTNFEQQKSLRTKGHKSSFIVACPIGSAYLDSFRTYDWTEAEPYPENALVQIRSLLALA